MISAELAGALVLGAGKGTRMKSDLPKVLQPILHEPLLFYILREISMAGIGSSAVVTGHKKEDVEAYISAKWPDIASIEQKEQLGTGHAVMISGPWWKQFPHVLVMPGDVPLITHHTLTALFKKHIEQENDCTFISFEPQDPTGYGRIVRTDEALSIVEEKDASDEERAVREVNSGIYLFRTEILAGNISSLSKSNSQNEYYLTDLIRLISSSGRKVAPMKIRNDSELSGINDPVQLSVASDLMKKRILQRHMMNGVKIMDPQSTFIAPMAELEQDVMIEPFVQIWGNTRIKKGAILGSHSTITDSTIGEKAHLIGHVVVNNSAISSNASLGPFAFVREGTSIDSNAFVGKFVEIKKSIIGEGTKVPHLSYIGDATIGKNTNIGAGTITCNYDGKQKNRTVIGDNSFVGSDTMLVAPVTLEDETFTAAGSVITHDVPSGSLAVSRTRQKNIEGWTKRKDCTDKRRK